ncbi:MAG: hypothetical protein KAW09_06955 [Thermoplasmata archaeon]|nr:hypothetical protein [Thermoplasmata archaeon]
MILGKRKQKQISTDPVTQRLVQDGVLSLHTDEGIYQASRGKTKFPYSFWVGTKYILTLSILLWWLPTLGQMIAGYVGGRKTGGPWKAVAAAILPVTLLFGISYMYDYGILAEQIGFILAIPSMFAGMIIVTVPMLAPYVEFAMEYIAAFVATLKVTFTAGLNGYLVTIIFAYIGGIVGQQTKRELVIRTVSPQVAVPTFITGRPIATASDTMKKSTTWWGKHPEKLDNMQKIPVRTVAKKKGRTAAPPKTVAKPKPKAAKTQTKTAKSKAPPQKELGRKGYDKGTVNKRLVERALDRYQRR